MLPPELRGSRFTGLTDVLRRQLHSGRLVDYAFIALFVVLLVAAALSSDNFFTHSNLINLARQIVTNGLISLGMLFVILSGGIDLSGCGTIVALGGIIAAGIVGDVPLALAVLVALAVGSLAGAVNGVLVARFRLPSFIVTLATLSTFRGLVYVYSDTPVSPEVSSFRSMLGGASIAGVPVPVIILVVCFAIGWLFLNRTVPGRTVTALGGNEEAVRLAGFNVRRSAGRCRTSSRGSPPRSPGSRSSRVGNRPTQSGSRL